MVKFVPVERAEVEIGGQTAEPRLCLNNRYPRPVAQEIVRRGQPGYTASEDSNVATLQVFFQTIHCTQDFLDFYCLEIKMTPAQITAIEAQRFQDTFSPRKILERIATSTYPALNRGNA